MMPHTPTVFAAMTQLVDGRTPFVEAMVIDVAGSTPRLAGARMVITAHTAFGTVGGGAFEHQIIGAAHDLLADDTRQTETVAYHLVHDLGMCCGGRMTAFLNKTTPAPALWIYGAGHVGTALAAAAQAAGFAVTVLDERAEWADPARFPDAVTVLDVDLETHPLPPPEVFTVVMTHSHPLDEALVRALTVTPRRFLGVIGSRRKWALFERRLLSRGLTPAQLAQVESPVGLPIDAQTPAEIAISVLGRLIQVRRKP
jgi:xanthine dehydrogenase accessory factor